MVQYRDLNAPPSRMLADVIADMKAQARQSKTGDAGVKDLGEAGDVVWPRPDGTPVSVRDIDADLADARGRIGDAEVSLGETQVRLDQAEQTVAATAEDLTRVETVVIPGVVADLEAADQAAQDQFTQLGTRLDTFGDDPALSGMRQALADAQATATSASEAAAAADKAASAASQAALEAAGIAASKGRTIIQATEPQGEDRNAANIWIKPVEDNPDTEVEERATTYVYLADSDEWVPTTSDELAQAAQNALDAREAAQQAQQRAEIAISNAAAAQAAAEVAQRTADKATTDARDAHNEAVAAQEAADEALAAYGPLDQRTLDAQAAADTAQKRADAAYTEAASKATPQQVAAAQKAATDAAAADAKAKADAALAAARADLAAARTQITAEIKASANGKNSITVSTSAPTSSTPGVVAGDTWWRVDASGNIYGQWAWNSSTWVARTIRSEMIANLDVHKLQVTGTAKIPVAVIDKLFAETFVAHKITGSELSIASVKPDGTLADGSVSAVTIKDGAITTPKLKVTEDMSAAIVNAMSVNTKKLVVTQETILNHATLIGQTVVDDINVQGKLIGKDGVFTGTVDFENVNVSDQVLASRISGEHIYGTVVEGGEIRTSDGLPGQVILSDEGYVDPAGGVKFPGIRIIPVDTSKLVTPPGMGPNSNGFVITGGRNVTGGRAFSIYSPDSGIMGFQRGSARSNVGVNDRTAWIDAADGNGNHGYIISDPTSAFVETKAADGSSGLIEATSSYAVVGTRDPGGKYMSQIRSNGREAYLWSTGSDGLGRVLSVDSDGVWVKAQRGDGSGFWDHYNLTKTASDSGWIRFNAHTGISTQSNPGLRNKGGIVWAIGFLTRPAGWPSGWTRVAGSFAAWLRPPTDILKPIATSASQRGLIRMTQTGYLEVWWSEAVPGNYQVDISALSYPVD